MNMRMIASYAAIALGVILIIGGGATWYLVSDTLAEQEITVAGDASCAAGDAVDGPYSAYCQAQIIQEHTMESTGGLTYAQLDREDPLRNVAMNSSFLQASLFTSVLAFGVAAMAGGMGVIMVLLGLGMRDVAQVAEEIPARV